MNRSTAIAFVTLLALFELACGPYATKRDKTAKGAGNGAAVGAGVALATGEREADEILARAAIGAVGGAGIGAYMDSQQEQLARIPGTSVERVRQDVLLVRFESDVLFDVDSSVIRDEGRETLVQVADVVDEFDKTAIIVQGPERCADAARQYLVGRGVSQQRIQAIGDQQLNRRVEILLKAKA